ncbi:MAG: hypothetical protein QM773_01010 [Hyphomonadaceae bacterium]
MSRVKVTTYVTPEFVDAIRRVAAVKDRSTSDVFRDAIERYFATARPEAEHHALMAKLENMAERLGGVEKSIEALFELTCHATRFTMSLAPEIPDPDKAAFSARGRQRFRNLITAIVSRLQAGRSAWRDHFSGPTIEETNPPSGEDPQ